MCIIFQEGDNIQAEKHADIAVDADHYNPAGMMIKSFLTRKVKNVMTF